jgi:predicted transcriptional regulator
MAAVRLGYLERQVLEWLWERSWGDVKSAHVSIGVPRKLSASTLHSTLERLVRKGLAERTKRGRAYRYRVVVSREDWVRESLATALEAIPGAEPELLLASFVDIAERIDAAGLEELERRVRERRRVRRGEEEP